MLFGLQKYTVVRARQGPHCGSPECVPGYPGTYYPKVGPPHRIERVGIHNVLVVVLCLWAGVTSAIISLCVVREVMPYNVRVWLCAHGWPNK